MASTGAQQAIAGGTQQPTSIQVTSRQRWVDLVLVLLIGIAPLVVSSFYQLFFPIPGTRLSTNLRFSVGLVQETGALVLCFTLLRRQGKSLKDIGFGFNWIDLPRAIGLCFLSYVAMIVVSMAIQSLYFFWTGSHLQFRDPKVIFAGASTTLFALYIIAAPVFEETLVRGYLMTELIGLSCPVWLATMASFVLQGSYHLYYGVAGSLVATTGFVVLAVYFAFSRKLMPVILTHLIWDLTATYLNFHH